MFAMAANKGPRAVDQWQNLHRRRSQSINDRNRLRFGSQHAAQAAQSGSEHLWDLLRRVRFADFGPCELVREFLHIEFFLPTHSFFYQLLLIDWRGFILNLLIFSNFIAYLLKVLIF